VRLRVEEKFVSGADAARVKFAVSFGNSPQSIPARFVITARGVRPFAGTELPHLSQEIFDA